MLTAAQTELLKTGIAIQMDADLTPKGKRTARVVRHAINGKKNPGAVPLVCRWAGLHGQAADAGKH